MCLFFLKRVTRDKADLRCMADQQRGCSQALFHSCRPTTMVGVVNMRAVSIRRHFCIYTVAAIIGGYSAIMALRC